jgi:carbon storage regulator CsrA
MLFLTRRKGKKVYLDIDGKRIVVEVAAIGKSEAKLGITAPPECKIIREELSA